MALLHSLRIAWKRFSQAARREFLRDPDVLLFERVFGPDTTKGETNH